MAYIPFKPLGVSLEGWDASPQVPSWMLAAWSNPLLIEICRGYGRQADPGRVVPSRPDVRTWTGGHVVCVAARLDGSKVGLIS